MTGADRWLEESLRRAEVALDRAAEAERAAGRSEPPDPAVAAALAAVAADGATRAEAAVADEVVAGRVAWHDVWADPESLGPGGVRLVQRALVALARDLPRVTDGPP